MLASCLTLTMLDGAALVERPAVVPLLPNEEHLERDVYNAPNVARSEHFALRWGDSVELSLSQEEILLEALELSWAVQIEEQGYPPPSGTDQYLFNVYLGDSGASLPSSMGASGYYTTDLEGWPMVVLGPYVYEHEDRHLSTIPHEFFHAVQHSIGHYLEDARAKWYWEATATWMEGEVFPEESLTGIFLFGFLFNPHLAINAAPEFEGEASDYFSYGAFAFIDRLVELTEVDAVRESWTQASVLPLQWWTDRLRTQSLEMSDVLVDFAARRVLLDLTDVELYEADLIQYAQAYPQEDHRITAQLPSSGNTTFREVLTEFFPQRGGYNHVMLQSPLWDTMVVQVETEAFGSLGSTAIWSAQALVFSDPEAQPQRHELQFNEGLAEVELSQLSDVDRISLIVSSWSDQDRPSEQFFYSYRIHQKEEDEEELQSGCRSDKSYLMLLPFLFGWLRRNKRTL